MYYLFILILVFVMFLLLFLYYQQKTILKNLLIFNQFCIVSHY